MFYKVQTKHDESSLNMCQHRQYGKIVENTLQFPSLLPLRISSLTKSILRLDKTRKRNWCNFWSRSSRMLNSCDSLLSAGCASSLGSSFDIFFHDKTRTYPSLSLFFVLIISYFAVVRTHFKVVRSRLSSDSFLERCLFCHHCLKLTQKGYCKIHLPQLNCKPQQDRHHISAQKEWTH